MTKFKAIGELELVEVVPVVDVLVPELLAGMEPPPSVIVPVQSGLTV